MRKRIPPGYPSSPPLVPPRLCGTARLPEAVAAHCLSFLESGDHAACACVCDRFRRLALVRGGYPASVAVLDSRQLARATPALVRMRPSVLTVRVTAPSSLSGPSSSSPSPGAVVCLLHDQSRMRHLIVRSERPEYDVDVEMKGVDRGKVFAACTRFDALASAERSDQWLVGLVRRMPHVATLHCAAVSARRRLPFKCAPSLTALHIAHVAYDNDDRPTQIREFARHIFDGLPVLRTLVLRDAAVWMDDLGGCASRLESLEVAKLLGRADLVMDRLTHLVAAMPYGVVRDNLPRFPALLTARIAVGSAVHKTSDQKSQLVAQLRERRVSCGYVEAQLIPTEYLQMNLRDLTGCGLVTAFAALRAPPTAYDFETGAPKRLRDAMATEYARLASPKPECSRDREIA